MDLSEVFSIIYFVGFVISFVIGLIVIFDDEKNRMYRLFFLMCIALCLWLFSFSYINLQSDPTIALNWRKLSVLGWGMLYAYLLHYSILLTNKAKLEQKPWASFLIYLPALIVVYVFSISSASSEQYNIIQTDMGWVDISVNNAWDWFCYIYLIVYLCASILLLSTWQKKLDNQETKKQVRHLIIATIIATVLGFFTDIIINSVTDLHVPHLAALFTLIPVIAVYFSITNHNFLASGESETELPDEILSESSTIRYYRIVSLGFFMGAIVEYVGNIYFFRKPLSGSLVGILFFAVGIMISIVSTYCKNRNLRDTIFITLISLLAPIITIFFDFNTLITTWSLPASLVLVSIIFNKKHLIFSLASSIVLSQVVQWVKNPQATVQISSGDYFRKMFFFLIFMFIALYVRQTYLSRLKKIENKIVLQKFVLHVTKELNTADEESINGKIIDTLKISGKYLNADRVFIYIYSLNNAKYEWCDIGVPPLVGFPQVYNKMVFETIRPKGYNKVIKVPRAEIITYESGDKGVFENKDSTKSLFAIPLTLECKTIGLLCYATSEKFSMWEKPDPDLIEIFVNIAADTLSRIKAEKHVNHLAYHDTLTNLPNKTAFDKFVKEKLQPVSTAKWAILLINYENFKFVNLTMGYDYANGIIKTAAEKLFTLDHDNFKLFHVSIDRFVFCVSDYDTNSDLEKLCETIMSLLQSSSSEKSIIGNIGVVELTQDKMDGNTLLKYATIAANSVINSSGWGYSFFSNYMCANLHRRNQIEKEIAQIIKDGQNSSSFQLEYQPIVDLRTNKIASFEALARMHSEEFGKISPTEFIQIAEETHQIYELGEIVLRKALAFINLLASIGHSEVKVCVNISALQLLRDNFLPDLFSIIESSGINPSSLDLELTESVFSEDFTALNEKLMLLKSKGIHISIDDFGTGYSSFARERDLCVNCIKIDKLFIDKLLEIEPEQAITGDIISMAHKLGHCVVAEGVETEVQKQYLIEHDCDFMQGYLFSPPVPQDQAIALF